MTDINEPIDLVGHETRGCAEGYHELDPGSNKFEPHGELMLVSMHCSLCDRTIVREEKMSVLIPPTRGEQRRDPPVKAPEFTLEKNASESDDYWNQFK